ncbi:MAG: FtsX-like permease family protein [Gemmatimonadetes bacterium]|nr:FtsX-like permease family protein [Gemmatimonadota bacterium]MYG17811.1 FtsX-like permease family protein [Gemmatimonadota bacterium]
MYSRIFGYFFLAVGVLLFLAVSVAGPAWVTEHVILRIVSLPEDVPPRPLEEAPVTWEEVSEIVTPERVEAHVRAMSENPSRVVGYPGNRAAMEYVVDAFHAGGLAEVTVDTFTVSSPVDHGFTLTVHDSVGTEMPVYQFWPNLVRLNSFTDGIRGPLHYGRRGEFQAFNGKEIEGSIVLVDFDGRDQYLNARMLGARAVLFHDSGPGSVTNNQAQRKILDVPADVPRFWVPDPHAAAVLAAARSGDVEVTIRGRMTWERAETWNVMGWIPGRDEPLPGSDGTEKWKDRIVVLSAFYDAMSVVPGLAPGAESAGGIAAMLELMDVLRAHPPGYTVLFLATSAHFHGLQGVNDFLDRHQRKDEFFLERIPEEDRIPFDLFLGLDLTSRADQVGLFSYGDFIFFTSNLDILYEPYADRYLNYARKAGVHDDEDSRTAYLNTLTHPLRSQESFMPAGPAFDHEMVTLAGLHGMTFATVNDNRLLIDTPKDRIEYVDFPNLVRQIRTLGTLLPAMLSDPVAFDVDESIRLKDEGRDIEGRVLEFDRTVDFFKPNTPVSDALVVYEPGYQSHSGVRGFMVTHADSLGHFRHSMVRFPRGPTELRSYGLAADGRIVYAPDLGEEGNATFPLAVPNSSKVNNTIQVLFPCEEINLFDIVDPGVFVALDNLTVLGRDNSPLRKYGAAFVEDQSFFGNWMTNAAVVFARPEDRVKMFMSSGPRGVKYLLTNTPESWLDEPPVSISDDAMALAQGRGFTADQGLILYPFYQSALDLWSLNRARLMKLEDHGVTNARAAELHEESTEALRAAREALENRRYDAFAARSREAWGFEARAYPDVRYAADDTVDGIVFYFMLLVPFCFFLERLFFGFTDIRKRLASVGVIFAAVFMLLQNVHPAFQLSLTPYMVFLAFLILAMALIIITMIVTRFDTEMKNLTRSAAGLHEADIGRLSATAVAISLGISNLRKRKMRTALTAVTLTLLTFTVLSFTSFRTGIQFYTLDRENTPPYDGVLMRSLSWHSLPTSFLPYVENAFEDQADVVPRSWYEPEDMVSPYIDLRVRGKGTATTVQSILGLHADEPAVTALDRYLVPGGRWFAPDERSACLLPTELAERLDVGPEDVGTAEVEILGGRYTVIGLLDSDGFDAYRDMDDESIMPASFSMTRTLTDMDIEVFMSTIQASEHLPSRNVLVLPYRQTLDLNGSTRSVAIAGFADGEELRDSVEAFMSRVLLAVFVGMEDEVRVYSSLGATSVSGLANLIIPVLIAAFLVLNTMMGAVFERFREIGVYSAVGLAPNHVAALFIAEAAVFATLGAVFGYLSGQIITMGLSQWDLLGGMSLNYSSLSTVYATMVVMAIVFLSTLYPAKKAADMTVEDVTRRWSPPPPDEDDWCFEFPFTVTVPEALPLSGYLNHIFQTHEDSSAEDFVAEGTTLDAIPGDNYDTYHVASTVWLAPYDLAISQDVRLELEPVLHEKLYRILIVIHRRSGDLAQWQTINRRFFTVLRKRFLVWRTLAEPIKARYRDVRAFDRHTAL